MIGLIFLFKSVAVPSTRNVVAFFESEARAETMSLPSLDSTWRMLIQKSAAPSEYGRGLV